MLSYKIINLYIEWYLHYTLDYYINYEYNIIYIQISFSFDPPKTSSKLRHCNDFIHQKTCCEILKYSQVYEPYRSIVGQERGRTHRHLNERRKIKSNLNQINPNLV